MGRLIPLDKKKCDHVFPCPNCGGKVWFLNQEKDAGPLSEIHNAECFDCQHIMTWSTEND